MKYLLMIVAILVVCQTEAQAENREVVLQTIAMESSNQSPYGQYLVASVIVNRANGGSLGGVCKARKQFSCWNSPKWAKTWLDSHYTPKARQNASNALEKALLKPYPGIKHYHTVKSKPYWSKGKKPSIIEGDHKFYSNIK